MWHVSSRSGVATLRTAIHLLLVTRVKDGADGAKTGRWDYQSKGVRPTVLLPLTSQNAHQHHHQFITIIVDPVTLSAKT